MVEEVKNNSQKKSGPFLHVSMPDGTTRDYSVGEASAKGLNFSNVNNDTRTYTYKGEDGRDLFTQDIANLPASITLNEETGNIQITAPKEITDSEMFKRAFDEETLNQYSLAYKLNPEYKISITEKNEETGEDEDKEVTIPEYIERLNSSINNYMSNLRDLHRTRDNLVKKYGDKANNLSDEKMAIVTQDPSDSIYLPDSLFNVNSFGNKKNPFMELKDKRNADGLVSLEDFAKVYTRDNFGRDEMAGLLAHLEGHLKGSDWSTEDTYSDSDGIEHENRNSATEAAKILAFKNYIMTKNPDAEWNQQAGDYIESLFTNAAHQVTRIFGNMANLGEMVVTRGEGTTVQQGIQEMDDAMEYFNENNTLVWDAVVNAQIWGTIGGIALGTWGVGKLMSLPATGIKSLSGALTAKRIAMLAEKSEEISLGAKLAFGALTATERTAAAMNVAITGISKVANRNIFTQYVFDTMHDAILYDAAGFRSMLTSLAEEADVNDKAAVALDYWLQQYTDNAKWWGPMGLGRTIVKGAGKTALGKAANMIITKYENKFQAFVGKKTQSIQDNMAGGSVVRKLEEKLNSLNENEKTKRLRLERKIEIEKNNELLRQARERLGNIKLDWDGVKLTEESSNEWRKAMTEIKAREVAIDLYRNGVEAETRIMHQAFKDPATGKPMFLYEELAGANMKATKWYFGLVDLSNKHGLKVAEKSLLNQDVIDYWLGSYKYNVMDFVANSKSSNAADAQKAAEIGAENIAKIRARLPEDITNYIDEGINSQIFQQYYKQLNEYGVANKILNKEEIDSYNANEIWIKNGYMPIIVKNDVTGRWISDDDKIESIVEQEMQHYRYSTRVDEHYADPELVRQTRIRHFAQARTNVDIWKSYSGFGSNATNITVVSGEETAYAKRAQNSVQALQDAVNNYARSVFSEAKIGDIVKVKPRKTKGNNTIEEETMDTIVANMSPSEVADFLRQKRILTADKPTLSGEVTEENYYEWFKNQSVQVKKYLLGKYAAYGDSTNSFNAYVNVGMRGSTEYRSMYYGEDLENFYKKTRRGEEELLSDSFLKDRLGVQNPRGFRDFIEEHRDEISASSEYDLVDQALSWYKQEKLDSVFYSAENQEFLENLGMPTEYESIASGSRAAARYKYDSKNDLNILEINSNYILSLPELQALELHEAAHAAWIRAKSATQMRVSQDLIDKLGIKLTVDEKLACSREMNELIAYATQARFETQQGMRSIMNDTKFKKHLSNLAKKAGVDLTPSFKNKVVTLIKSFVAFVKTKLLGINDAKTFDEFYNGLLSGNFADDISSDVNKFIKLKRIRPNRFSYASDIDESRMSSAGMNANSEGLDNLRPATNEDYPGWDVDGRGGQASELFRMLDESNPKATAEGSLRDYYRDWKGKQVAVVEMEPDDYTKLMADTNRSLNPTDETKQKIKDYAKRFKDGERSPIPYLVYDKEGNLTGQEGRHRALAAKEAGIDKMPVVIDYSVGARPAILDNFKDVTEHFVKRADDSTDVSAQDNLRRIQVSGEEEASNIPVRFTQSENTAPINAGQEGATQPNSIVIEGVPNIGWLSSGGQDTNRIKIPIKEKSTGKTSIFVDFGSPNSYDLFRRALQDGGNDFEEGLERAYIVGSEKLAKTSLVNEAARNLEAGKDAFYEGTMLARIRGELRGILNVDTDAFVDDVYQEIKGLTDAYVREMLNSPATQDALKLLADDANASDDVYKFLVLQELSKKENMEKAAEALNGKLKKIFDKKKFKSLKHGDVDLMKKKAGELLVGVIDNEKNMARLAANTVSPGLLDTKDLFDRVKDINKRIKEADERLGQDYVMYLDDEGRSVYAQVDPTFASLFNYRYRLEKGEASALAKVNAAMSRAFRYGTTSVNLSSFGNQMFRDFGNAILVGGSWQTIKTNYQNLVDVFGERIVEQIRRFDPTGYEMKQVEEYAQKAGKSVEEAAVSRELARGQAMAPSTTERSLYKNFMREAYSNKSDKLLTKAEGDIKKILNKLNPEDLLNGKRENYLRNRVFASSLNDAIKEGYTLEQARVYAHFAMNNVTTNFSRGVYHLQAIADSTPYFRAAINGTKSFWRVWSLDPVGVSGRIMGGLIIPTMYLTGMSLGSEENKEVYMNIPEYQKENSMVFVMNGQPFSIPIPQELGAVVAPFRQFVEYLHNTNKNDFWELMMNDLLGLSPVDIQGFSSIDMDRMIQDPTAFDRIGRGFSRMFSQMAPVPVKTAYMLATGTDPYTGKSLRDKSYMYWNEETGSLEVMDYNQNVFAQWFADLFGEWMSPELAEKIVSGIIGTTGSNLLGDFAKLVQEQSGLAMLKNMGTNIVEQSSKPFTIRKYDLTTSIWKRAIQELTTEKDAILNSKEMKKISSELAQTKDPEKRQKLLAQQQDIVDNFQQKVKDVVTRLSTEYDGSLDRKKLAAVLTLLNFNSDSAFQTGTQYSSNISSELFWDGRDAAVHTLERMGVTGTSDMSIFGYLSTEKNTGKPVVKYNNPIAILDMDAQWDNQDDVHAANIKAILSQNDMYDAHEAVSDQIQKIYGSKSKLTNADRANIEAIQINWNAQLAKTIAPYVAKMTPEAAINNTQVLNALYPYVEVPGSWETNDKGRFVSLGSRGNKKKAYYDSWIKSMFSINDQYKGQY